MSQAVPINKIIPLSTVDGPGCRTSIFVQGCNIGCMYCHNPETQNVCRDCGLCVPGCPSSALTISVQGKVEWTPSLCQECDQCLNTCPFNASPRVRVMTPAQVMDEVIPQRPFIRGITLSGGECTLYPEFLTELLGLAKAQGLTTLLDFNGVIDLTRQPELMSVTDGVMMDVKAWNPGVFQQLTGAQSGSYMKENLVWLAERGQLEELRLVCVDGHVDTETCLHGVAQTIPNHVANTKLKLIAFRNHGVRGALADAPSTPSATMQGYAALARELGFQCVDIR